MGGGESNMVFYDNKSYPICLKRGIKGNDWDKGWGWLIPEKKNFETIFNDKTALSTILWLLSPLPFLCLSICFFVSGPKFVFVKFWKVLKKLSGC